MSVDSATLVYHIDLFQLSIVALFFLVSLPRIIALFGTTSEWFDGYFLRYVPYRPSTRMSPKHISNNSYTSHSSHTHTSHVQQVTANGAPASMRYPPHVASCFEFLRPILTFLRLRISPGFSVAQAFVLSIYFTSLAYASFYESNIFTDEARTGWVAIAQLPLVFALSQKNNVMGAFIGYGYNHVTLSKQKSL